MLSAQNWYIQLANHSSWKNTFWYNMVQPDHINKAQRYHNFLMLISWQNWKKSFFSMGVWTSSAHLGNGMKPCVPEEVVAQVQPVRHRLGFFHVFFSMFFPWNRSIAKFREIHWMVWYGISIVFPITILCDTQQNIHNIHGKRAL